MDKPLTQETQDALRAQARQIAVAHNLDADIQEELYGHFEDKALAYLSGDEAVTEADAVLLVTKHFGDPAELKTLLQQVHHVDAAASLARRLAAVMILYALVSMLLYAGIQKGIQEGLYLQKQVGSNPVFFGWLVALPLVATWIMGGMLFRWQARLEQEKRLWVYRMPAWCLGALWTVCMLFWIRHMLFVATLIPYQYVSGRSSVLPQAFGIISFAATVGQVVLWLWWCDRPPRSTNALFRASSAWVIFSAAPMLHNSSISTIYFAHGADWETWAMISIPALFGLGFALLTLCVGRGLYRLAQRLSKPPTVEHGNRVIIRMLRK